MSLLLQTTVISIPLNTILIMKYYNPLVDKKPVEVKIIQYHKDRVEITRDLNGNAGFWINKKELIIDKVAGC